jgi:hypothetical protein
VETILSCFCLLTAAIRLLLILHSAFCILHSVSCSTDHIVAGFFRFVSIVPFQKIISKTPFFVVQIYKLYKKTAHFHQNGKNRLRI